MSEEFLNTSEICSSIKQVRCEGVTERVRVRRHHGTAVEDPARIAWRKPFSPCVEEDCVRSFVTASANGLDKFGPSGTDPNPQRFSRWRRKWYPPPLASLTHHVNSRCRQVKFGMSERTRFCYTEARTVEQLEERSVTPARCRVGVCIWTIEQIRDLFVFEDAGQSRLAPGRCQAHGGVDRDSPATVEPTEVSPQRRRSTGERGRRQARGHTERQVPP